MSRCNSNHKGVPNCDEPVFILPGETSSEICLKHLLIKIYIAGKIAGRFSRPDAESYQHLPKLLINLLEEYRINRELGVF